MFYLMTIHPVIGILRAQSWNEIPCRILSSEVESHGDTYSPAISYEYAVNDQKYTSNRYDFTTGSSSGYEPKKRVVDSYPVGSESVCYVDPVDPAKAVLNRSFTSSLFWGLLAMPFLGVGLGGLYFIWRPQRDKTAASSAANVARARFDASAFTPAAESSFGPVELKSRASPKAKFLVMTFVALFWNGITGVFVYKIVQDFIQGAPNGCMTAFMIPFVLVGLLVIYGAIHQFLALFNPRPTLRLNPGYVRPGDSFDLEWSFSGNAGRLSKMRLQLKGVEHATYRRGTDSVTDTSVFESIEVINTTDNYQIKQGRARVRVPEDTMHTFESSHNKIAWTIHISGEVPKWPDVDEEFELVVRPHRASH
jgi:hypothetical protein